MKKRIVLTAALILLCGCSDKRTEITGEEHLCETSSAVTAEDISQEREKDYSYTIENGEAYIGKYVGEDTEVLIPETLGGCHVTGVNKRAFMSSGAVSITFPSGVKSIDGFRAPSAEVIHLPSGISELSYSALSYCAKLREIYIEDGGRYRVENGAVLTADGSGLVFLPPKMQGECFEVPDGVRWIADGACRGNCFTEIILPKSVERIGDSAFAYSDIKSITLNEGLLYIGEGAFGVCRRLTELYLPDSVESVGYGFADDNVKIEAYAEAEGLSYLNELDDVTYRNETLLQAAMRKGVKEQKNFIKNNNFGDHEIKFRIIFTDINGDDFPEMLSYPYGMGCKSFDVYYYSVETDSWLRNGSFDLDEGLCYYTAIYRDRKNDSCFQLQLAEGDYTIAEYAVKTMWNESGMFKEYVGYSSLFFPVGHYGSDGFVSYYRIGDRFETVVYSPEEFNSQKPWIDFRNMAEEYFSDCELLSEIDIADYFDMLSSTDDMVIYDGEFADEPNVTQKQEYDLTRPERKVIGEIGEQTIYEDDTALYIYDEELSYDDFRLLSQLPGLTALDIKKEGCVDLSGIELLKGLKRLNLYCDEYTNTQYLSQLSELEWFMVNAVPDMSFISDMDSVRVLEIYNTDDMPEDIFTPAYDMKGLEYLIVSKWNNNMTEEQEKNFMNKRPDVKLCFYKIG